MNISHIHIRRVVYSLRQSDIIIICSYNDFWFVTSLLLHIVLSYFIIAYRLMFFNAVYEIIWILTVNKIVIISLKLSLPFPLLQQSLFLFLNFPFTNFLKNLNRRLCQIMETKRLWRIILKRNNKQNFERLSNKNLEDTSNTIIATSVFPASATH